MAGQGRLGKDMVMAPSAGARVEVAGMSAGAYRLFCELEKVAGVSRAEMIQLVSPSFNLVADLERRLRPGDWFERLTKSYVSVGVLSDLGLELCRQGFPEAFEKARGVHHDLGHAQWAAAQIKQAVGADPALADRLSLWGRRVVGESMGVVRLCEQIYPGIFADLNIEAGTIMRPLMAMHGERMVAAGLKA